MERLELWRVGAVAPNPLVAQADQGRVAMGKRAPWPLAEMDLVMVFLLVEVGVVTMAVVAGENSLILIMA